MTKTIDQLCAEAMQRLNYYIDRIFNQHKKSFLAGDIWQPQ